MPNATPAKSWPQRKGPCGTAKWKRRQEAKLDRKKSHSRTIMTGCIGRHSAIKSNRLRIECVNQYVNHTHRVIFFDVFVPSGRKKNALRAFNSLNESFHGPPVGSGVKPSRRNTRNGKWCTRKLQTFKMYQVKWRDLDNTDHSWRAVDVERAFYALGAQP
jgi:hypothetical protein